MKNTKDYTHLDWLEQNRERLSTILSTVEYGSNEWLALKLKLNIVDKCMIVFSCPDESDCFEI